MAFDVAGAAVSNVYYTQPLLDRQRSGDRPSQTRPRAGGDVGRACARDSPPPSAEGDKLPMRPIDILRDLGMSEDTIATYLWRWQWAESSTILQ